MKKRLLLFAAILLILFFVTNRLMNIATLPSGEGTTDLPLETAVAEQLTDVVVSGSGVVIHILSDDMKGSRHQRFIVKVDQKQTLLIVHNIDLAPRIDSLRQGDKIDFKGKYVWNKKGGLIHWTHHDPTGKDPGGWIQHQGILYQ